MCIFVARAKKMVNSVKNQSKQGKKSASKKQKSSKHNLLDFLHKDEFGKASIRLSVPVHLMIAYLTFFLVFYAMYFFISIEKPVALVFGTFVRGALAYFANGAIILVLTMFIIGLLRQKRYTFYMGILWFSFSILNAFVSFALNRGLLVSVSPLLQIASILSIIFINGISLWYLIVEKEYFTSSRFEIHAKKMLDKKKAVPASTLSRLGIELKAGWHDKVYSWFVICICVALFIVIMIAGTQFYKKVLLTTINTYDELEDKFMWQARDICLGKYGLQRDICYLVMVDQIDNQEIRDTLGLCEHIDSDMIRLGCYKS